MIIFSDYGVMYDSEMEEIQIEILKIFASHKVTVGQAKMICEQLPIELDKRTILQPGQGDSKNHINSKGMEKC